MKIKLIFFTLLLIILLPVKVFAGNPIISYEKGYVLGVEKLDNAIVNEEEIVNTNGFSDGKHIQEVSVKIISGKDKGQIVKIIHTINNDAFDVIVEKGDKLFLYTYFDDGVTTYSIRDIWHLDNLIILCLALMFFVILLGGIQGFKSILTLAISLFLIFSIFIPSIKNGYNPVLTSVYISSIVSLVTLPIIHGFSRKAIVSIIGTIGGITIAYLFSELIILFMKIGGLGSEDIRLFAYSNPNFNFEGILFAGIIIGALGAIMDVAVSISSGLQEVRLHSKNISYKNLFNSGMNIGRDIMGSMLNTLIFAYVGASMATILIIQQNNIGMMEFLNYDFVVEEFMRAIIGSIGLLATIPITSLMAGLLHKYIKK